MIPCHSHILCHFCLVFNGLGSDTLNREWNGTILSGETSFQFSISTVPDNFAELDEQFDITIEGKLEPKLVVVHEEGGSALVVIEDDGKHCALFSVHV